jgi:phage gp46-like protein
VEGYPDLIGSRLWLLKRTPITAPVLVRLKAYAEEALAWMLVDEVVGALDVTVTQTGLNSVEIVADYFQNGSKKTFTTKWTNS